MNPSNAEDGLPAQSPTHSSTQSSSNIQVQAIDDDHCCHWCQKYFLKLVEKLFIVCGTFAISFFLFGILSLQNGGKNGDTFFLIGAAFVIIIGIYMANQRGRIQRLHALQGNGQAGRLSGQPSEIPADVYVVPLALPERSNSNQPLISPTSIFGSPEGNGNSHKPSDDGDDPPRYEDVVAGPPPYESLNPSNLRS